MLGFIIAPFFIALLIYVFLRSIRFIETYKIRGTKIIEIIFGLILFGGLCCMIVGFLIPTGLSLKRTFTRIGYYWLGVILYFFVGLLIALVCRLLVWLFAKNKGYNKNIARKITTLFVAIFTTLMSIYGIINAHTLRVTNYEVISNKKSNLDELNIVLISDLHLGYNDGLKEMKDMASKINSLEPDVVILAGDIFDNEYEAIENSEEIAEVLYSISSKYGKYAVYGNHDIQEKIFMGFTFNWSKQSKQKAVADDRMNKFVQNSGFTLLYDSYEMIEDIYIYGRPDYHKINFGNSNRKSASDITSNLDKDHPIICVDHQPGELYELAKAGVDLDLSGHTHNGQIWPGTISINWVWDNAYGLKQIDNMTSIVTSGVGLFGVNMRTGCYPEIVNIKMVFKK